MRKLRCTMLVLLLAVPFVRVVDYKSIGRKLLKEPAYRSGKPLYALLLFGREAKLRVWIAVDGDTYYLDRDGAGDLTGKDKRFATRQDFKNITLADPDGKTTYLITGAGSYVETEPPRKALMVNVTIKGPANYQQYCDVALVDDPAQAQVTHFHGPLTAQAVRYNWKLPSGLALKAGAKGTDVRMLVGTVDEKSGCWTVVRTHELEKSTFGEGVYPQVEVEWPAAKVGAAPIRERTPLKAVC